MPSTARATSGRHLARLVVLVGALAGLFAMHGLADHGSTHRTPAAPTSASTELTPAHSSPMLVPPVVGHGAHVGHDDLGAPATDDETPAPMPTSDLLTGVCMAVLAAALARLLLAAVAHLGAPRVLRRARPAVTGLATTARFRDPPSLFTLCVQRC